MRLRGSEIAAAVGGRVRGDPSRVFAGVTVDSRRVRQGDLFVALPGARADGHDFVASALAAGAAGALVAREPSAPLPEDACLLLCDEPLGALQRLAAAWRARLRARVIGVAGSNGKTTTKEALAAVLAEAGRAFATPGNQNSQVGAPLSLLSVPLDADFVVLELGTSRLGELRRLAGMARPDHAVVTAAFAEHLEWLRDTAGVVEAETEILEGLAPEGFALVGSAEPRLVAAARSRSRLRVQSLGRRTEDDWRLSDVELRPDGTRFRLSGAVPATEWHVPLLGEPAAWSASFAIALARSLGLDEETIRAGLSRLRPAPHRLEPIRHARLPLLVIDDCYNANPASCAAAIELAAALRRPGERLVLVLGDMLELGEATREAHREVGCHVARHAPSADLVVTVGEASRELAEQARRGGARVAEVADAAEALASLRALVDDSRPTTVLVKASRSTGLDRVVAGLESL